MGNVLLFLLGMRDNLGVFLGDVPIRFGELAMILFSGAVALKHRRRRNSKSLTVVIIFMILHMFIVLPSVSLQSSYPVKYVFRLLVVIIFLISVNHASIDNIHFDFEKCMRWMIIIFVLCLGLEQMGYWIWMCRIENYSGHGFMGINRFSGTASEPGYFLEVGILPFYYFMKKNNKKYLFLSSVFLLLTFSVAVYAGIFLVIILDRVIDMREKHRFSISKKQMRMALILIGLVFIGGIAISLSPYNHILMALYEKAGSFMSKTKTSDYSTKVRLKIVKAAIDELGRNDIVDWLFGNGLGSFLGYSEQLWKDGLLYHYGESPDNVYLGVLFDSGILGLFTYLMALGITIKQLPKTIEAKVVYVAFVVTVCHNYIVSGMWLFSAWVEMGLLFIINKKTERMEYKGKL